MRPKRTSRGFSAPIAITVLILFSKPAVSQSPPTSILPSSIPAIASSTSASSARANANLTNTPSTQPMAVSLYANPYMNPWVNPMLMNGQYNRSDMGWYLFAGQQATLGLGTGRLNAIRDDPRSKPPREVNVPLPSRVPGASAHGYFQRGSTAGRPSTGYFQRNNGNFHSNGH